MSGCPFHHGEATPPASMPERIAKLPVLRGFPVPWFVAKVDGEFDFRIADRAKFRSAIFRQLCWVCGEKLGKFKSFVIGPMCGINRTTAEPPAHRECAIYSAQFCPFLSRPNMKRREDDLTKSLEGGVAGEMIKRNPGACGVWTTESFKLFQDDHNGVLFEIGEPTSVEWFCEGRPATRAEVAHSIDSGIHHLVDACNREETPELAAEALRELIQRREDFARYLPQS